MQPMISSTLNSLVKKLRNDNIDKICEILLLNYSFSESNEQQSSVFQELLNLNDDLKLQIEGFQTFNKRN